MSNRSLIIVSGNQYAVFVTAVHVSLTLAESCLHYTGIFKNVGFSVYFMHADKLAVLFVVVISISHIGDPAVNRTVSFAVKICSY